jgi:uncharacterized protein YukJ
MALAYGYVKAKVVSSPTMKASRRPHETQYHLHFSLLVDGDRWDVAVNVGTNDADDQLKYKLVFDFRHPIVESLKAANAGSHDLTGQSALPALDFMRSDLLDSTGAWRDSDVMDGSDAPDPAASVKRLISKAQSEELDVYIFGRFYSEGDGIHDIHMNQGSTGRFIHRAGYDSTTTMTCGRTADCWSTRGKTSGLPFSRRSTSSSSRRTSSAIRYPDRRRFSAANRSSHHDCRKSDCELRVQSGTRIMGLLVSFDSEVRIGPCCKLGRTSESGH